MAVLTEMHHTMSQVKKGSAIINIEVENYGNYKLQPAACIPAITENRCCTLTFQTLKFTTRIKYNNILNLFYTR